MVVVHRSKTMQCLEVDQLKTVKFWKALFVEFLGTLLLILVGCGSCPGKDIVRISLTFGLGVATVVWVIGHVSGGHNQSCRHRRIPTDTQIRLYSVLPHYFKQPKSTISQFCAR